MKNIHLLPTDKPSRLHKYDFDGFALSKEALNWKEAKKIYITSDEEIKEGDWVLYTKGNKIHYQKLENKNDVELANIEDSGAFKIILTTDQDLIKDGVQVIDDEFLEWFVKNPSCEEVEIRKEYITPLGDIVETCYDNERLNYKIIIPKEEPKQEHSKYLSCCKSLEECHCDKKPKQETLEEAIKREYETRKFNSDFPFDPQSFKLGAKWQQERMYSEEDLEVAYFEGREGLYSFNDWLRQFKNK